MSNNIACKPTVSVGILSAPSLTVSFHGAWADDKGLRMDGQELTVDTPRAFTPLGGLSTFTLRRVLIGKQYHWQKQEDQTFFGALRIIREGDGLTAVNVIGIEKYLESVISSEMSAEAPAEFLKAAAVISRSWLVRQISDRTQTPQLPPAQTADTIIRWQDHTSHTLYDVCADDHCQRYQGIARITNANALRAVSETAGEVLAYNGEVCDCRFSKCCGGRTEEFATCWQDRDVPYLHSVADIDPRDGTVLCATEDKTVLRQVLNDYDLPTTDFYRWERRYTQMEISGLVERKLHRRLGSIVEIEPLHRGPGGRISLLRIKGSEGGVTIGKELLIREALSRTHLLSSAFRVEPLEKDANGVPAGFVLRGRGWGHGVGLCQIGAAVMGNRGYDYREILFHYYPHTQITHLDTIV